MEHPNRPLDRHKIAAIIMTAIINAPLIDCKSDNQDEIYFGNYILAIDCGLDYLLDEINQVLRKNNKTELNAFYFPEATACKTSYYKIFFRNLYFADQKKKINTLDIAERLFLLECLTFEKEGINSQLFKEY